MPSTDVASYLDDQPPQLPGATGLRRAEPRSFPPLDWDVAATVGGDGLVQVKACFFTSATDPSPVCSPANDLQLIAHAFGDSYATEAVGPGTVSLLTGDFSVAANRTGPSPALS